MPRTTPDLRFGRRSPRRRLAALYRREDRLRAMPQTIATGRKLVQLLGQIGRLEEEIAGRPYERPSQRRPWLPWVCRKCCLVHEAAEPCSNTGEVSR